MENDNFCRPSGHNEDIVQERLPPRLHSRQSPEEAMGQKLMNFQLHGGGKERKQTD